MSPRDPKLQIVVVRSWTEDLRPIRDALADAGVSAELTTADFEASLHAALTRGGFAAAIYDPQTPGLTREAVLACLRACDCEIPLILVGDLATLGERVLAAVASRSN